MRTLFTIVGLLGLLLAVLSAFEVLAARDYRFKVKEVQEALAEIDKEQMAIAEAQAKPRQLIITGTSTAQEYGPRLDGVDAFEIGWLIVACVGAALLFIGIRGIVIVRKTTQSETGSIPSPADPA